MNVILADAAGFCYGVRRAVELCEKAAEMSDSCVTLGPIIHNRSVTDDLASKGVREVSDPSKVAAGDTVVIRSPRHRKSRLQEADEQWRQNCRCHMSERFEDTRNCSERM